MIKFFRKIRQKMLTENKLSKYLFYAIGEIVLVVIGILIALSINNWNEKKKNISTKVESLKLIQENLKQEETRLNYVISRKEITTQQLQELLSGNINVVKIENLYDLLTQSHSHLITNAGYKTISQNNYINLIDNSELINELIFFYESHYEFLNKVGIYDTNYAQNYMEPFLLKNIPSEKGRFDENEILAKNIEDMNFRNLLLKKIELDEWYISVIKNQTIQHIRKLENLIQQELYN
jgi:hypothetical protein